MFFACPSSIMLPKIQVVSIPVDFTESLYNFILLTEKLEVKLKNLKQTLFKTVFKLLTNSLTGSNCFKENFSVHKFMAEVLKQYAWTVKFPFSEEITFHFHRLVWKAYMKTSFSHPCLKLGNSPHPLLYLFINQI